MASIVAGFGSSHSTMLFSSAENWLKLFDHVDRKAPVHDFGGVARSFEALLESTPAEAARQIAPEVLARRHAETVAAMDRLEAAIAAARLDALIIIGDDQREIFQDACRPAIGIYYGESIRNAAAPASAGAGAGADWYVRDQHRRLEDGADRHYPCHAALAAHVIAGLSGRGFDITAIKALTGEQFEGHAYSFIHRRYMRDAAIPIVPVFLNTYYPPNQPTPQRCHDLGAAIAALVETFPGDLRVGLLASGGLSHFLVNEELDRRVTAALAEDDAAALTALPAALLQSGSSEIRNWIALSAAMSGRLRLQWLDYVPGYRSRAMTGVGLCFAHWA